MLPQIHRDRAADSPPSRCDDSVVPPNSTRNDIHPLSPNGNTLLTGLRSRLPDTLSSDANLQSLQPRQTSARNTDELGRQSQSNRARHRGRAHSHSRSNRRRRVVQLERVRRLAVTRPAAAHASRTDLDQRATNSATAGHRASRLESAFVHPTVTSATRVTEHRRLRVASGLLKDRFNSLLADHGWSGEIRHIPVCLISGAPRKSRLSQATLSNPWTAFFNNQLASPAPPPAQPDPGTMHFSARRPPLPANERQARLAPGSQFTPLQLWRPRFEMSVVEVRAGIAHGSIKQAHVAHALDSLSTHCRPQPLPVEWMVPMSINFEPCIDDNAAGRVVLERVAIKLHRAIHSAGNTEGPVAADLVVVHDAIVVPR